MLDKTRKMLVARLVQTNWREDHAEHRRSRKVLETQCKMPECVKYGMVYRQARNRARQ